MDGRQGQPVTFERKYEGLARLDNSMLCDIPPATYKISGEDVLPDGRRVPVLLLDADGQWKESLSGAFEPNLERAALEAMQFYFTRQTD